MLAAILFPVMVAVAPPVPFHQGFQFKKPETVVLKVRAVATIRLSPEQIPEVVAKLRAKEPNLVETDTHAEFPVDDRFPGQRKYEKAWGSLDKTSGMLTVFLYVDPTYDHPHVPDFVDRMDPVTRELTIGAVFLGIALLLLLL